jgi:hypothetical protein
LADIWRYFGRYQCILADIWPIPITPISRLADTDTDTNMADTDIPFADTDISVSVSAKYIG